MYRKSGSKKAQFFSYDVIAAAAIFLIAFFLVTFYWLNLRSQTNDTADLQRQAVRISDNLMSANTANSAEWLFKYYEGGGKGGNWKGIDDVAVIPSVSLLKENTNNRLDESSFFLLIVLSNSSFSNFYAESRQKLGVPLYNYYIAIEDESGKVYNCENFASNLTGSGVPTGATLACAAGLAPAPGSAVAGQERLIAFNPTFLTSPERPVLLARLKVQIWR